MGGNVNAACLALKSGAFRPGSEAEVASYILGEGASLSRGDRAALLDAASDCGLDHDAVRAALDDPDTIPDEYGLHGLCTAAKEWDDAKRGIVADPRANAGKRKAEMENTIDGVVNELHKLGYAESIGYDTLANRITVIGELPWDRGNDPEAWGDYDKAQTAAALQRANPNVAQRNIEDGVLITARERPFNPLTRMLDGLPRWDGKPRAATLLEKFFCVEPCPYEREAIQLFMRGAIMRAYHPGCKFDYVLTIVSPDEGIGKSTFAQWMSLSDRFFLDDVSHIGDKKASGEEMRGKWICELGEMKAIRRVDRDTANAFLTRTTDTYRPSYGRDAKDFPRSVVFLGTCNDLEWMDAVGNARRYLPVTCPRKDSMPPGSFPLTDYDEVRGKELRDYIAQAWAEVLAQYREHCSNGGPFPLVLPRDVQAEAIEVREAAKPLDERAEAIRGYLEEQSLIADPVHRRQNIESICEGALGMDRADTLKDRATCSYVRQILTRQAPRWGWHKESKRQRMDGYSYAVTCWDYRPRC